MTAKTKAVETSDIAEDVVDLVEDTAEFVEAKASWIVKNPKTLIFGALIVGIVIGGAATYLVASKKIQAKAQIEADAAIEDVKNHYAILRKDDADLDEMAAKYSDEARVVVDTIIADEGYTSYDKVPTVIEDVTTEAQEDAEEADDLADVVRRNIFESDNPDTYFDFDEELKRRAEKPNDPFVITKEEFDVGEADYDQAMLTYYDGDDVLADSKDQPLDQIDMAVGFENLLRFGHGSEDPNVVYIRNSKLGLDFEVVHSDGKFAKEVLGFDDELKHSDKRVPRKFRTRDE